MDEETQLRKAIIELVHHRRYGCKRIADMLRVAVRRLNHKPVELVRCKESL